MAGLGAAPSASVPLPFRPTNLAIRLNLILFIACLLFFGWLVIKIPFFKKAGIPAGILLAVFFIKVFAGMAYGKMFTLMPNFQQTADTWRFFFESLKEKDWLLNDPGGWLVDLWKPRYANDGGVLNTHNSLFNDLKDMVFVKLLAVFNLFSGGRYFVNIIFFNFITLFGLAGLARVWSAFFGFTNSGWMLLGICLWPSVLFWNSGLHRDGLLLHSLGMLCWIVFATLKNGSKPNGWLIAGFAFHLGLAFVFRSYLVALAIPSLFAAVVWLKWPEQRRWSIPALALLALLVLLGLGTIYPSLSLPALLHHRLQEFSALKGDSMLTPLALDSSWASLFTHLPQAAYRAFLVPFAGLATRTTDWLFAAENLLWLASIIPALLHWRKINSSASLKSWMMGVAIWVLLVLLLIGLTIPFGTAIVRYRSILWPFMLPLVLAWWLSFVKKQKPGWHW